MDDYISLRGVNVNNLKDLDLDIKKGEITVFTGLSGSGKSSLVFDTIAAEAKRQMNMNQPMYLRRRMELIERPDVRLINHLTPSIVVNQKSLGGGSSSTVGTVIDASPLIRLLFSRTARPNLELASSYRRSDPKGMCPVCKGKGEIKSLDEKSLFNLDSTVAENGIDFEPINGSWQKTVYMKSGLFDVNKPLRDFTDKERKNLAYGPDEEYKVKFLSNNTGQSFEETYEGVIPRFNRLYLNRDISRLSKKVRDKTEEKLDRKVCKSCGGSGFSKEVLESKINGYNIVDYYNMEMDLLLKELKNIDDKLGYSIAKQIIKMASRMVKAGIGYLNLARRVDSLSGGERQRLKLVANLGSSLNNLTYILDEPTAGLHQHDIGKVKNLLTDLKEDGNTVLVVEHNREIMAMADWIVDLGPYAGSKGGNIVFEGKYKDFLKSDTLTSKCLNRDYSFPKAKKDFEDFYEITKASTNNLKNFSVKFPKKALTVISGVAGSGKSSLVHGEFMKKYPHSIYIDQKGIGISSRSTPATYINIMDEIRKLFARENQTKKSMFSFNSKGACPVCKGKGSLKPDVAFADPVTVKCESCDGTRYNKKARSYKYKGLNIVEVLKLTVSEAREFFKGQKKIVKRLDLLAEVGLSYMSLGQSTSSLSGGELQRLKLALELQEKGNIYILDEPSTGLHMADIKNLISLIDKLIEKENTVLVIEHNPDFYLRADYIVDLGPGAGKDGGNLIFEGYPQDIIKCKKSLTGAYLKSLTKKD